MARDGHEPRAGSDWAPPLGVLRLLGDGRSAALLSPDADVLWWCAPDFDDPPLCWRLLDEAGGAARFPQLQHVEAGEAPAGASATTLLRDRTGTVEVRDALLSRPDGVLLVRLLRRRPGGTGPVPPVEHELSLGGFDAARTTWSVTEGAAAGSVGASRQIAVRGGRHAVRGTTLLTSLDVTEQAWTALVVGVGATADADAAALLAQVEEQDAAEQRRLDACRLPHTHPGRALDAIAVLRACTSTRSGAVVASPTTSLPEAPGHDRQFDYRYTWLRDASLSTAVAALLGKGGDARRYLDFVHRAWDGRDLLTRPMLDVRGGEVPAEREVDGVAGWAGSRPVRVGNGASGQRQYDSLGLLAEAVSVFVQVGGRLDDDTWALVRRLADEAAADADRVRDSNGIWEMRVAQPLVDGDIGRWLLLDRALWIARGWRPWTPRRHWKRAREAVRARVVAAVDDAGLLPQAYDQDPPVPDASALMAVAFGLLDGDDPRAHRLVDAVLERLGAGPYVYRYPAGGDDGFDGTEGAFLPVSFLAVTALAQLGRVEEAEQRLDRLCASLPRLLAEEVDPRTGAVLGNVPLVWSHAELARSIYVLDAAKRRDRWGAVGSWAWRLQRYLRLRHDMRATDPSDAPTDPDQQEDPMTTTRDRPAGPPAATLRPGSGGVGRAGSPAAEAVSDALRRGSSPHLDARRRTAALQTAAAGALAVVGLYQFGLLRSVPEPGLPGLGADAVDASGEAYQVLRTPDSALGIASAGVSLVLAGMGGARRHEEQPWIPLVLLAKSLLDAAGGTYLFAEQVTRHKKVCSWCTVSAGLLLATVPTVLPEARAAWKVLRRR